MRDTENNNSYYWLSVQTITCNPHQLPHPTGSNPLQEIVEKVNMGYELIKKGKIKREYLNIFQSYLLWSKVRVIETKTT